jgi:hypothetical protein
MQPRVQRSLIVGFLLLLWAVGLQTVTHVIPIPEQLYGATVEPQPARWSWAELRSGGLFRSLDDGFNANLGFRRFWAGLNNQLNYTVFGEATPNPKGTEIIVGDDDWLFEAVYIEEAVKLRLWNDDWFRGYLETLQSVQAKLKRRGITFLLLVAPSKVDVYPEHVPPAYFTLRRPSEVKTVYEHARPLLESAGIAWYDSRSHFAGWKAAGQPDLFARSGSHWSYLSALEVLREVRERLNRSLRRPIPELRLRAAPVGPPRYSDRDLLKLLNLLVSSPYSHDLPYTEMEHQAAVPPGDLPRILFVHDSFGLNLFKILYSANAIQPADSFYYFKTRVHWPEETRTPFSPDGVDWEKFLQSYDAVVVVCSEVTFDAKAWGFLEALDQNLK